MAEAKEIVFPSWFRVCIAVLCVVSVLWVPLVQSSARGQLFVYIQAIQGYLGTAVGPVFVLAVFWKRTTEAVRKTVVVLILPKQAETNSDSRPH